MPYRNLLTEREIVNYNIPNNFINVKKLVLNQNTSIRGEHFHKELEIVYVKSGTIVCKIQEEKIEIDKDTILLINGNVIHGLKPHSEEAEIHYIQIDMSQYVMKNTISEESILKLFLLHKNGERYRIFAKESDFMTLFLRILDEYYADVKFSAYFINAYVYNMLAIMYRTDFICLDKSVFTEKELIHIMPVIHYVEENYYNDVSLSSVCEIVHINKTYFCRLFKRATNATFTEYLNYVRIYNALDLLKKTTLSVTDISVQCGFSSIQYFNIQFKKIVGITPFKYKSLFTVEK